ncbi:hypothetical protein Lalb_Chr00c06g0404581 [Lupinus albus]|uniref:Uncharacterized protein n=1 Tax=Lupinus albus TaxID=3870 RepID=A0A6A4N5U7_LUPAL|nr:hypothetical protein Lalb_Chr00c06g0404581 [Lupinus albus]
MLLSACNRLHGLCNRLHHVKCTYLMLLSACNRLHGLCNRLHCPKLPFLARVIQLLLRRESSSIAQDFTLPDAPLSLKRESLDQARLPGLIL